MQGNESGKKREKDPMRRKAKRQHMITRQQKCRVQNTPRKAKERARKAAFRAGKAARR